MRALLLALLLLATGCGAGETRVDALHAFVRRSGPTADTLRVERGADSLAVAVDLRVAVGRATWTLRGPDGQVAWAGAVTEGDTAATWTAAAPAPGDWRLELRPERAVGTFEAQGRAW